MLRTWLAEWCTENDEEALLWRHIKNLWLLPSYGRFPFVRTTRPDHCRTSHLDNEIGFFRGFLWNFIFLPAHYLGFDWSGWIVLTNGEILITTGRLWPVGSDKWKAPSVCVCYTVHILMLCWVPASFFYVIGLSHVLSSYLYYWLYYYLLIQHQDITISRLFTLSHKTTSGFIITPIFHENLQNHCHLWS